VLEDLMPLAEAKNIDIGIEGSQDAEVRVNEMDIVAIVKNLVDNAIRYTPDNGRIDLLLEKTVNHALMRIRDDGPGIPLIERERIFDPFYRTLGNEQTGSGLGLSIVATVIARIGAEIRLDFSDPLAQTGLTVTVSIPIEPGFSIDTRIDKPLRAMTIAQ
jgi:two-component system OmpR family sensor kinase